MAQEIWNDVEDFISKEFAVGRIEHDYDLLELLGEIYRDERRKTKSLASMTRLLLGKHKFPIQDTRETREAAFDVPRDGDLAVGFVLISDDESNDLSSGVVTLEISVRGFKVGETRIVKNSNKDEGPLFANTLPRIAIHGESSKHASLSHCAVPGEIKLHCGKRI